MINLCIKKRNRILLGSRKNTGIRIGVFHAFVCRLLLLAKREVEGYIQHHHSGEVLGESHLFVWSQLRHILYTLMIIVGERIPHHHLYRPFLLVITESDGMVCLALRNSFAFQVVIGSIHICHEYPVLVHADDTSAESPIAMCMKIIITFANITIEKWIQTKGKIFLERTDLDVCLTFQMMRTRIAFFFVGKYLWKGPGKR